MSKPRALASSGESTVAYAHEISARNGWIAAIKAGLGVKAGRGALFGATFTCGRNAGGAPPGPPNPPSPPGPPGPGGRAPAAVFCGYPSNVVSTVCRTRPE